MSTRRERILTAARDLFLTGGVEAVTMRGVAERVGVSATAIYRHFRDKDAVIRAVVELGRDRFAARLFEALEGTSPRDRLRRTGLAYVGFAIDEPEHFEVFFLSAGRLGTEKETAERPLTGPTDQPPPARQFLLDRLQECAAAGLLVEPVDLAAMFLWAEVHGLATMWVASGLRHRMPRPVFESLVQRCVDRAVDAVLVLAPPSILDPVG
jgi:AcrR family transcriptional regulator